MSADRTTTSLDAYLTNVPPFNESKFQRLEALAIAHFSIANSTTFGNLGDLPPALMPYNSTLWSFENITQSFAAPFIDFGHNCSQNGPFSSLGNCVCYKGSPISLELLDGDRAICNTAPGYLWGFSSSLTRLALALEAAWMACCFVCYLWLTLGGSSVSNEAMRSAGPMKFALEFGEAVSGPRDPNHAGLTEKELEKKLEKVKIGYRSEPFRIASGLNHDESFTESVFGRFEAALAEDADHIKKYIRKRRPTRAEIYEDLNWQVYDGRG